MIKNLIGEKFNFLTVIDGPYIKNKKTYWKCLCDCGKETLSRADGLKSGQTKSCGCYKNKIFIENNKKRQTLDLTNKKFGKLTAIEPTELRSDDGRVIWKCQCDCGNNINVSSHDLKEYRTQSCGCLKSKGELEIEKILTKNNLSFERQKTFNNCRFPNSNYLAKFDFYVENKYLIEFDGEQHYYYNKSNNSWNTKENYLKIQERDKYKNQWCKDNNIPLIRIPYFILSKISIEDLLLDSSKYII